MPVDALELAALREELGDRVRALLVDRVSVRCAPDAIDPDAPLFGAGLGLDSVDAIELVIALESELGVMVPDGEEGLAVLRSVGRIVDFIVAARRAGGA
jgi:acyl carrier protein